MITHWKTIIICLFVLVITFVPYKSNAAQRYTITDIGTLGGERSASPSINNIGQVVGQSETSTGQFSAFLWTDGVIYDIGTYDREKGGATDINNLGQVLINNYDTSSDRPPTNYVWTDNNGNFQIDPEELLVVGDGCCTWAREINDSTQVTGSSGITQGAFFWENGEMIALETLGGSDSEAFGINNLGQIVGLNSPSGNPYFHAFLWEDVNGNRQADPGEMIDLGTLGGNRSRAEAINDLSQVVGWAQTDNDYVHAFLWEDSNANRQADPGEMMDLGVLLDESQAYDINNIGQVVGVSNLAGVIDENARPFLWSEGTLSDLNDLIPADSGWKLVQAIGINDAGKIVGHGLVDLDGDGIFDEGHAFLLTPVQDTDGDGIPDDEDACPFSDLNGTVVIDGCDSGVDNVLIDDGCTISDLISQCAEDAANHDEFVSCVSHTTNYLMEIGKISGKEKGMIQKCAAIADIP